MEDKPRPRLLDRVRERCRVRHLSLRTERSYVIWVKRFIHFHGLRHPNEMGAPEVEAFLTHLAVRRNFSFRPRSRVSIRVRASTDAIIYMNRLYSA